MLRQLTMGLFDLLSKDKRDERARSKNVKQAVNKFAQSVDRSKALEALADDGSDEALYGLLRRFGMNYDKTIEDEHTSRGTSVTPPRRCSSSPTSGPSTTAARRHWRPPI
jgi:hypothetical protein